MQLSFFSHKQIVSGSFDYSLSYYHRRARRLLALRRFRTLVSALGPSALSRRGKLALIVEIRGIKLFTTRIDHMLLTIPNSESVPDYPSMTVETTFLG